jgi:hypothetical protein
MMMPSSGPAWLLLIAVCVFASSIVIFDSAEATRSHAYLRSVVDAPPLPPAANGGGLSAASALVAIQKKGSARPPAPSCSPTAAALAAAPAPTPRRRLVVVGDAEELRAALQPHRLAAPLEAADDEGPTPLGEAAAPTPNAWGYSAATTILINSALPIELSAPLVVPAGADVRLASSQSALLASPSGRAALRGRDTRLIEVDKRARARPQIHFMTCWGGLSSCRP